MVPNPKGRGHKRTGTPVWGYDPNQKQNTNQQSQIKPHDKKINK